MLECNRNIHKKVTNLIRIVALLLPVLCAVLLTSQVVFAKNTYVINDGNRVHYHTTYATDPAEILTEAGIELGKDDTYTTQDGIGMSEINIQRKLVVGLTYRGESQTVTTQGLTVAEVLEELGIVPGEHDVVSLPLDAEVYEGMQIVVDRFHDIQETYTVSVPYGTSYVLDPALAPGQQLVVSQGVEGQVQMVDAVSYLNGIEYARVNQIATVLTEPVKQVIAVGSLEGISEADILEGDHTSGPSTTTGDGQLHIGDGMIITPDGQILTYTGTLGVVATAYHNSDPGCTIYTAIGTYCRVGAIAVDPRIIPYGTRMYIVTDDGQYIYGTAVAEDCGSSIKGNRVDLYFDSVAECWQFGIRNATVYFLG